DRAACLARAARTRDLGYGWTERLAIPDYMSLDEARFWFAFHSQLRTGISPSDVAAKFANKDVEVDVSGAKLRKMLTEGYGCDLRVLSYLFSSAEILEALLERDRHATSMAPLFSAFAFRDKILVHRPESELKALRQMLDERIAADQTLVHASHGTSYYAAV